MALCLPWCKDAYFLFTGHRFPISRHKAHANPKKIWSVDHTLRSALGAGILVQKGHLRKTLGFTAWHQMTTHIHSCRSWHGRAADFVVPVPDRTGKLGAGG